MCLNKYSVVPSTTPIVLTIAAIVTMDGLIGSLGTSQLTAYYGWIGSLYEMVAIVFFHPEVQWSLGAGFIYKGFQLNSYAREKIEA